MRRMAFLSGAALGAAWHNLIERHGWTALAAYLLAILFAYLALKPWKAPYEQRP